MAALSRAEQRSVLQILQSRSGSSGSSASSSPSSSTSLPRRRYTSTSALRPSPPSSHPAAGSSYSSSTSRSRPADRFSSNRTYGRDIPDAATLQGMRVSPRLREKPSLPTYYTARPTYIATLLQLEELTRRSKRALEQIFVLPRNSAPLSANPAADSTPAGGAGAAAWLSAADVAPRLGMANLKASQYRNIIAHLTALARYRSLVEEHLRTADPALAREVEEALQSFARKGGAQDKQGASVVTSLEGLELATAEQLDADLKKNKFVDEYGRAYAFGRRKESSARVWIIPTFPSSSSEGSELQPTPTIGQVLVNNQPLSNFFSRIDHREKVTWPLKLAGKIGVFNIFALVRGGGNSGQAGAVAHGVAKALVVAADAGLVPGANEEEVERIKSVLMKDGILRRDPRMVERKKTGKLKARKAFTWVKR